METIFFVDAGLEQSQELLVGADGDPLGNRSLAVRGKAVDGSTVPVHEVDQGAHGDQFAIAPMASV